MADELQESSQGEMEGKWKNNVASLCRKDRLPCLNKSNSRVPREGCWVRNQSSNAGAAEQSTSAVENTHLGFLLRNEMCLRKSHCFYIMIRIRYAYKMTLSVETAGCESVLL